MTRDEARAILERDGVLSYRAWTFSASYWSCAEGCCDGTAATVEEMLDEIASFCGAYWDKVKEL